MAWNNQTPKDPWGKKNAGPPDLDKLFDALLGRFKKRKTSAPPSSSPSTPPPTKKHYPVAYLIPVAILVLLLLWALSGIYIVGPAEEAVVLQFGRYVGIESSGMHWIPSLIDTKTRVNVQQVYSFGYQADMLTADENIVSVEVAVQYRIDKPFEYLYAVSNPVLSLQQATASAVRQVIGQTNLDDILTTKRETITEEIQIQLIKTLSAYNTGLSVIQVTLQSTKPPEEVTDAFNDAIKAREDEQRYQNQALAYASNVVPVAEGQAKRLLAEAKAYQQQVTLEARTQVAAFLALLPSYEKAPLAMRHRLYLETIESMLSHSRKVLLTDTRQQNILYLPFNPTMKQAPLAKTNVTPAKELLPETAAPAANSIYPYFNVPQEGS